MLKPTKSDEPPSGLGGRYVYCTDPEVHVQRKGEDEVVLKLLAPQSPKVRCFFLVCYADPYFSRLVAVQLVEVQGLRAEAVRVCAGQSVDRTLHLAPVEVLDAAAVRLYSSAPELVAVQPVADLDPKCGGKFVAAVSSLQVGVRSCRLHAVDPATRRIAAALLVTVEADLPEVKTAHEIALPVLWATQKRLPYQNESTKPVRYTVRSSDPTLVTVQTPELAMEALETRHIDLLFHACPASVVSFTAEAFLYITSEDRAIQETRLLRLTYT